MNRNTNKDDDADNKLRKAGGGGFLSSLRRSGILRVPAAALEEIRPMIGNGSSHITSSNINNSGSSIINNSNIGNITGVSSGSSVASGGTTSKGIRSVTPPTSSVTRLSASSHHHLHHHHSLHSNYHHHHHDNFEISVRDKTDATAKRGFRVQVPKRMLLYTVLVFLGLPLVIFLYVEMNMPQHASNHEQRLKMLETNTGNVQQQPQPQPHHTSRHHHVGLSDVLPHSTEQTGGAAENNAAPVDETTTMTTTNSTLSLSVQGGITLNGGEAGTNLEPAKDVAGLPKVASVDQEVPDSPTQHVAATTNEVSSKKQIERDDNNDKAGEKKSVKGMDSVEPPPIFTVDKGADSTSSEGVVTTQTTAETKDGGVVAETAEGVEIAKDATPIKNVPNDPTPVVVVDAAAARHRTLLRRRTQR